MSKFFKGFQYAWQGLSYAFSTQINFRFHAFAAALITLFGFVADLSGAEWLWILLSVFLVIVCELFNTAIEVLVDIVSPGYSREAGIVKDLASAAVLISAVFAFITAIIIFIPKI